MTKEEKTLLGIKSTTRLKEKILKQHAPITHRFNSGYGLRQAARKLTIAQGDEKLTYRTVDKRPGYSIISIYRYF
jgi:hypothetical protein